ncbi:MAG: response regulator [Lachnospiraceae bacterium]|jgi:signal transduction histidine kinase/CheY-like chemotaxis protein/HPt (histidine-containing phosphotransfer) domain-containing protein|nr:response regulator [Lachnospiraceae bacterium]
MRFILRKFFDKKLDLRERLFHILALAGIGISGVVTIYAVIRQYGAGSTLISLFSCLLSIFLLFFSVTTGKYRVCYFITIFCIFLVVLPSLFFGAGGNFGEMPLFFVFAILFTVFMLDGIWGILIPFFELIVYSVMFVIAYLHPALLGNPESRRETFMDTLSSFILVSIALSISLFLHIRMFRRQQIELEAARTQALQANRAKSQFLATMSHEIRTPINIILGKNELIRRDCRSDKIAMYSREISESGKTLLSLINNILDVSKIEQSKFTLSLHHYDSENLINRLSTIGRALAAKYSLAFFLDMNDILPKTLTGDEEHILRIVTNFLSNAAKYTPKGSITLNVSTAESELTNVILLKLSVIDTGIGVDMDKLPYLFNPFTRIEDDNTKKIEGSGLGLAISKELAEMMNGSVSVNSKKGIGSTFTLTVPQQIALASQTGYVKESQTLSMFTALGARILVTDDHPANLKLLCEMLSNTEILIDTALSGEDCIRQVQEKHYDVILMDYMMPQMDGIETLKRLQALKGFQTPVIVVTANVLAETRETLQNSGFTRYISKPVSLSELFSALLDLLPKDKICMVTSDTLNEYHTNGLERIADLLGNSGIDLDDGLEYLSGDMTQYRQFAEIFSEGYLGERKELESAFATDDYQELRHKTHSLKGRAAQIGANGLSTTAARIEQQCKLLLHARATSDDTHKEFIRLLLPILYFEWQQVIEVLKEMEVRLGDKAKDTSRR